MSINSARRLAAAALASALLLASAFAPRSTAALAQSRRTPPEAPQKKNTRPDEKQTTDQQQQTEPQEPAPPDTLKEQEVVRVATNIVQIEAVVYNKKSGQIINGLKKENFAIFEDGVQKDITNFATPDAPVTVSLVLEYSKLGQWQSYAGSMGQDPYGMEEMMGPTVAFLQQFIKPPNDYVSVIAYDMRVTPLTDFTNDPARISQVISLLLRNQPVYNEANLYDALKLTLVGGKADSVVLENSKSSTSEYSGMTSLKDSRRKAIFLITTGIDTFSKINYDQARKIVQNAGIPIYIIGTGEKYFKLYDSQMGAQDGLLGATQPGRMTMLQARNALKTFADESGGAYYPVTFEGELPKVLQSINALMRSQYSLAYSVGERRDGKQHKIVVKVDVDGDGKYDDKDFVVKAREFYNSPKSQ
ncbi:MAG TPA: VWA domain-containing protein [Pyrinomonadaceae bacterium]|nr:VWA domain-containing protein [Pyrinomonadaceae bacterium]